MKRCSVTHFATFRTTVRIQSVRLHLVERLHSEEKLINSLEWRVGFQKLEIGWGLQLKGTKLHKAGRNEIFIFFFLIEV